MKSTCRKTATSIGLNLLLFLITASFARALEIEAITKPSSDVELSFVVPGKIKELLVKKGQHAQKGCLLARLEDDVETIQYELLSATAKNTIKIETARAELAQKQQDLQKMEMALKEGAVTTLEIEHGRLAVNIAQLALKSAQFEHEQDIMKMRETKAILDQLHLLSPIDGIVEEIKTEPGESMQAHSVVLRVVNIDPLLLDVAVPVDQVKSLPLNGRVDIKNPDGSKSQGFIETISSVADAAAATLNVRVKVSNPQNRHAGERVPVSFGN